MSPYTKKILRNIEGKVLPYSVLILLIVAGLTTMFFVFPQSDTTVHADSVITDFLYNKNITIDHTQVPNNLVNFPVLINITDTDLKDSCLGSGWDIAFFDNDDNQLNHEIELYVNTTGRLVAWVNVTSLSSSADTVIHMYYGDSDIGSSAENISGVWSNGFRAVWHYNDITTSSIEDSTSYNINGTKKGANEPIQTTGKIGYAQNFDGSDDYITFGKSANLNNILGNNSFTLSSWVNPTTWTVDQQVLTRGEYYAGAGRYGIWFPLHDVRHTMLFARMDGTTSPYSFEGSTALNADTWYYCTWTYSKATGKMNMYLNGISQAAEYSGSTANVAYSSSYDSGFISGARIRGSDTTAFSDLNMDETRVSSTIRNTSWIITEYNNVNNATDGGFFSLGEGGSTYDGKYEITGLDGNTRFPFSGEADEIVWSTDNITMAIHTNISGTTNNCTDICIDFDSGIDTDIDEECFNITIARNVSDFTGNVYQVPNGGNITINASVWDAQAWCAGDNPFDQNGGYIDGVNRTFYLRVRVSIPVGKATGTYTTDSWKVLWKVIS